jgi:hydrogenase nickel incorporation protein HypB
MVQIETDILAKNNQYAAANRRYFGEHGILALNLVSSPGSGKTTLLARTIEDLKDRLSLAVIEGDQQTAHDAERIRATGAPALQINTGKGCHLDGHMVGHALETLQPRDGSVLFIENVGNLVCPASFDLGQHRNVTLLSVPEGDDKPSKYPVMFRAADMVAITKVDLLPVLDDFKVQRAQANVQALANPAPIISLSTRQPDSIGAWLEWLDEQVEQHRVACGRGDSLRPNVQPDGAMLHSMAT